MRRIFKILSIFLIIGLIAGAAVEILFRDGDKSIKFIIAALCYAIFLAYYMIKEKRRNSSSGKELKMK